MKKMRQKTIEAVEKMCNYIVMLQLCHDKGAVLGCIQ